MVSNLGIYTSIRWLLTLLCCVSTYFILCKHIFPSMSLTQSFRLQCQIHLFAHTCIFMYIILNDNWISLQIIIAMVVPFSSLKIFMGRVGCMCAWMEGLLRLYLDCTLRQGVFFWLILWLEDELKNKSNYFVLIPSFFFFLPKCYSRFKIRMILFSFFFSSRKLLTKLRT